MGKYTDLKAGSTTLTKGTHKLLDKLDEDAQYISSEAGNILSISRWFQKPSSNAVGSKQFSISGFINVFDSFAQYESANTQFDYDGNMLVGTVKTSPTNFTFYIPKEELEKSSNFRNATGNLYVKVNFVHSENATFQYKFYRITTIENNITGTLDKTVVANTNNSITLTINCATFNKTDLTSIALRVFNKTITPLVVGSTFKFGEFFIGQTLPLETNCVNSSSIFNVLNSFVEYKYPEILCVGDSLSGSTYYPLYFRNLFSINTIRKNWGGEGSAQIYKHLQAETNTDDFKRPTVIWVGRNDVNFNFLIDNIMKIIELIGHQKYIVLPFLYGNYATEKIGGANRLRNEAYNSKLRTIFGEKFIDINNELLEKWDFGGVRLGDTDSFVQPLVGANVQITVNDTTFFASSTGSQIAIGSKALSDIYTIMSVDSATLMTIRLDTSNVVAVGGTVGNYEYTAGTITAYDYLNIMLYSDYVDYNDGIYCGSLRNDDIHPSDLGAELQASLIGSKLKSLNYI